jgi:hypothetical protein
MAGTPCTLATTRHRPSPGSGAPAGDVSRAGTSVVTGLADVPARGLVPGPAALAGPEGAVSENCGLPPTLGGL